MTRGWRIALGLVLWRVSVQLMYLEQQAGAEWRWGSFALVTFLCVVIAFGGESDAGRRE